MMTDHVGRRGGNVKYNNQKGYVCAGNENEFEYELDLIKKVYIKLKCLRTNHVKDKLYYIHDQ